MAAERRNLFNRLTKGLEEGIAHERGEHNLRVTEIVVPHAGQFYTAERDYRLFALILYILYIDVSDFDLNAARPGQRHRP